MLGRERIFVQEVTDWTINMWKPYQTVRENAKFLLNFQRVEAPSYKTVTTLADGVNGIIIFQSPGNDQK